MSHGGPPVRNGRSAVKPPPPGHDDVPLPVKRPTIPGLLFDPDVGGSGVGDTFKLTVDAAVIVVEVEVQRWGRRL